MLFGRHNFALMCQKANASSQRNSVVCTKGTERGQLPPPRATLEVLQGTRARSRVQGQSNRCSGVVGLGRRTSRRDYGQPLRLRYCTDNACKKEHTSSQPVHEYLYKTPRIKKKQQVKPQSCGRLASVPYCISSRPIDAPSGSVLNVIASRVKFLNYIHISVYLLLAKHHTEKHRTSYLCLNFSWMADTASLTCPMSSCWNWAMDARILPCNRDKRHEQRQTTHNQTKPCRQTHHKTAAADRRVPEPPSAPPQQPCSTALPRMAGQIDPVVARIGTLPQQR